MQTVTRLSHTSERNLSLSSDDLPLYQASINTRIPKAQLHPVGLVTVRVSPPPPVSLISLPALSFDTKIDNPVMLEDGSFVADESGAFT